jgi:hypothetical protein
VWETSPEILADTYSIVVIHTSWFGGTCSSSALSRLLPMPCPLCARQAGWPK